MILIRSYTFFIGAAFLFPVALHGTQKEREQQILHFLKSLDKKRRSDKELIKEKTNVINEALKDKRHAKDAVFWEGVRKVCKNDATISKNFMHQLVKEVIQESWEARKGSKIIHLIDEIMTAPACPKEIINEVARGITLQKFRQVFAYSTTREYKTSNKKWMKTRFPNEDTLETIFDTIKEKTGQDIGKKLAEDILKDNTALPLNIWEEIEFLKSDDTIEEKMHNKIKKNLTLADVKEAYNYSYKIDYNHTLMPGRDMLRTILPQIPEKAIEFAKEALEDNSAKPLNTFLWVRYLLVKTLSSTSNDLITKRNEVLKNAEKKIREKLDFDNFKAFFSYKLTEEDKNSKDYYELGGKRDHYKIDNLLNRIISKNRASDFVQDALKDASSEGHFIATCVKFLVDRYKLAPSILQKNETSYATAIRLAGTEKFHEHIKLKYDKENEEKAKKQANFIIKEERISYARLHWLVISSANARKGKAKPLVDPKDIELPLKVALSISESSEAQSYESHPQHHLQSIVNAALQSQPSFRKKFFQQLKNEKTYEHEDHLMLMLHFLTIDKHGPQLSLEKDEIAALAPEITIELLESLQYKPKVKRDKISQVLEQQILKKFPDKLKKLQEHVFPKKDDNSLDWENIQWKKIRKLTSLPIIADSTDLPLREVLKKIKDSHFSIEKGDKLIDFIGASHTKLAEVLRPCFPDITVSPGIPPKVNWEDVDFGKGNWDHFKHLPNSIIDTKEMASAFAPGFKPSPYFNFEEVKWEEVQWSVLINFIEKSGIYFDKQDLRPIAKQVFPNIVFTGKRVDISHVAWENITHFKVAKWLIEKKTVSKAAFSEIPISFVKEKLSKATEGTPEAIFWEHVKAEKGGSDWGIWAFVAVITSIAFAGYAYLLKKKKPTYEPELLLSKEKNAAS
ncbi:MAG: hypothetical protein AAF335_04745, partial [Bacteroidota bacterium]